MKFELPNTALFMRTLSMDLRHWQGYVIRLVYLGLILFFLSEFADMAKYSTMLSALGLRFFQVTANMNLVFITLFGISLFSAAITEEKEVDSLGLLMMTGIGPFSMLTSKGSSKMLIAMMLILSQIPFTLLAITLGGISMGQILCAYVTILCYTILVANLALFNSIISPRSAVAAALTMFVLTFFNILTPIWVSTRFLSPFFRLNEILSTGFTVNSFSPTESVYLVFGIAFFLISLGLFNKFSRTTTQGINIQIRAPKTVKGKKRSWLLRTTRTWKNAIAWKEFYFTGGGLFGMVSFLFVGTMVMITSLTIISYNNGWPRQEQIGGVMMVMGLVVLLVQIGYFSSVLFSREVHEKTHSTLMMLPMTTWQIAVSKVFGSLFVTLPMLLTIFIGLCMVDYDDIRRALMDDDFYQATAVISFMALSFYNLTAYASLFIKHGSLVITVLLFFCLQVTMAMISEGSIVLNLVINGAIITIFPNLIIARLNELAGE